MKGNTMGEIRVKVTLKNAMDVQLHQLKKLAKKKIRSCEVDAIVDTGAVLTIVPQPILDKLGVGIRGTRVAEYADGRKEEVGMSHAVIIEILGRDTSEGVLAIGNEVLIGQTVLEAMDLLADCRRQKLVPNPAHPDHPVLMVR
jgi:clan AA aspartic protease